MVEPPGGLRFTEEARSLIFVGEGARRQEFEGYGALELEVLGLVNGPMPPSPSLAAIL